MTEFKDAFYYEKSTKFRAVWLAIIPILLLLASLVFFNIGDAFILKFFGMLTLILSVILVLVDIAIIVTILWMYFDYKGFKDNIDQEKTKLKEGEKFEELTKDELVNIAHNKYIIKNGQLIGKKPKKVKEVKSYTPYDREEIELEQESYTGEKYNDQ